MAEPKRPLSVWLSEIFFEDNPRFHRRAPRLVGLLAKAIALIPQTLAFAFCNFAATFPKSRAALSPRPLSAGLISHLALQDWPRRPDGGERGLPYSDSVVQRMSLGDSLTRVHDLVFAMREIHRVCVNDAAVEIPTTTSLDDPTAVRMITPEVLSFFTGEHPRAQRLGVAGLFDANLRAIKRGDAARPTRIDIGCGSIPKEGYAGVDRLPLPGVAIVRDVEQHGLPFSDSTLSHVYTAHFLEHVRDLVFVMNEIHRVCCHDALVEISVPTLMGPYAAADPTHVRLFNARTFSYFELSGEEYAGIQKGFEILEQYVGVSINAKLRVIKSGA